MNTTQAHPDANDLRAYDSGLFTTSARLVHIAQSITHQAGNLCGSVPSDLIELAPRTASEARGAVATRIERHIEALQVIAAELRGPQVDDCQDFSH